MSDSIKQSFSDYTVGIVTTDLVLTKIFEKAFKKRGGNLVFFQDGHAVLQHLKELPLDGLIVTGNLEKTDAEWISSRLRERKANESIVKVLWFIGDKPVRLMDGHTKRPFRPVDLLRPFYECLKKKEIEIQNTLYVADEKTKKKNAS